MIMRCKIQLNVTAWQQQRKSGYGFTFFLIYLSFVLVSYHAIVNMRNTRQVWET